MKSTQQALLLAAFLGLTSASPTGKRLAKRQVPAELSHFLYLTITQEFLQLDNPLEILDPVFGLLGNAAAAGGLADPDAINLDCLHQITADQAFTNAKAAEDVRGMAGALIYQALERNTGSVGLLSVICDETPVNPEIAAFAQHQDAAAEGALEINKAIALELANQLALIGVDPLLALEAGTFAPGDLNDNTGAGNTCDTEGDEIGCIFTDRLLVLDLDPEELLAAVADVVPTFTGTGVIEATNIDFNGLDIQGGGVFSGSVQTALAGAAAAVETGAPAVVCGGGAAAVADDAAADDAAAADDEAATGTVDIQSFTGALGGPAPPVVSSDAERPFAVNGATFNNVEAAINRSCDIQNNACFNAVNGGDLEGGTGQCGEQLDACKAAAALRR